MTNKRFWCLDEYKGETSPIVDGKFAPTNGWLCDKLNELYEENKELKEEISIFKGKDVEHYQRWVAQIKKYVDESNSNFEYDEDFIIKIALSYTLQSLRNGESLKRFQWEYKELEE